MMTRASRRRGRRRPVPQQAASRPRSLHLVDADNLIGDPRTTDLALIRAVLYAYRAAAGFVVGDLVTVATGTNGAHVLAVELAWPEVAHRRRRGPDGADRVLVDEATWAAQRRRFARVVVGSGDHIFLPAVELLLAAGIVVEVVAKRRSLSADLARSVPGHVHLLPEALAG